MAVTKVEAKDDKVVVTVEREAGGRRSPYWVVSVRPDGLYLLAEVDKAYDPPWRLLACPVKAGESWGGDSKRPDGITLEGKRTIEVVEMVKVPAGEFEGVRVTSGLDPRTGRPADVRWFAPGVGILQIGTDPPHLTLKSFTPGKD